MDKSSKEFLIKLLNTHSPSGNETELQKVWLNYVANFAEVKTDNIGNAYGILNPDAKFKVMLAGHCDEISLIINKVDENGHIWFTNCGWINPKMLPGMKVDVIGFTGKTIKGIVSTTAKDNAVAVNNCYIDCGFKDDKKLKKMVRIGDYAVYRCEPEIIGDNRLTCKALDNKTGAFIIAEVLRKLSKKKINVGVYSVSTTGEETNSRGAFASASRIKPDMALACDVTFDNEAPGGHGENAICAIGKGPALSFGSPINRKINELLEKTAKKKKIKYQLELTPDKTHTDADRIMYSGDGVPVALVSLPIKNMHSPVEMADMDDIENTIELIAATIESLTGKEDLRPVII